MERLRGRNSPSGPLLGATSRIQQRKAQHRKMPCCHPVLLASHPYPYQHSSPPLPPPPSLCPPLALVYQPLVHPSSRAPIPSIIKAVAGRSSASATWDTASFTSSPRHPSLAPVHHCPHRRSPAPHNRASPPFVASARVEPLIGRPCLAAEPSFAAVRGPTNHLLPPVA